MKGLKKEEDYHIYILRCEDGSLYTGIARDYRKRYKMHLKGTGAKYTRSRKPVRVEKVWLAAGRSKASRAEYYMKKNTRKKKEEFIERDGFFCSEVEKMLGVKLIEVQVEEWEINGEEIDHKAEGAQ